MAKKTPPAAAQDAPPPTPPASDTPPADPPPTDAASDAPPDDETAEDDAPPKPSTTKARPRAAKPAETPGGADGFRVHLTRPAPLGCGTREPGELGTLHLADGVDLRELLIALRNPALCDIRPA